MDWFDAYRYFRGDTLDDRLQRARQTPTPDVFNILSRTRGGAIDLDRPVPQVHLDRVRSHAGQVDLDDHHARRVDIHVGWRLRASREWRSNVPNYTDGAEESADPFERGVQCRRDVGAKKSGQRREVLADGLNEGA
jgi:hypothetical protein